MKTFKDLIIADKIWLVYTDYRSKEKPTFSEIKITGIELSDKKYLVINPSRSSYGRGHELEILFSEADVSKFERKGDGFYVTDYKLLVECLKDTALKHINDLEKGIKEYKNQIVGIRDVYWDYLQNNNVSEELLKTAKK